MRRKFAFLRPLDSKTKDAVGFDTLASARSQGPARDFGPAPFGAGTSASPPTRAGPVAKRTIIRIALPAAILAAAGIAALLFFQGTSGYLEGERIRLIEAVNDAAIKSSPLTELSVAPAKMGAAKIPSDRAGGKTPRNLLQLSPYYVQAGTARINAVSYRVMLGADTRSSLVCLAPTRLEFKLRIPAQARLRFALGKSHFKAKGATAAASARLRISIKHGWRGAQWVYDTETDAASAGSLNKWLEVSVPLDEAAGQRVKLVIEAESSVKGSEAQDVLFLANPVLAAETISSPDRPNIILVSADALRADHLGCYGYFRPTSPAIDRLSQNAVLFENALSQASWTLPSFASLFTSLYPSFHGTASYDTRLFPDSATLTGILRNAGYTTVACVNNRFIFPRHGFADFFDQFYGPKETPERQLAPIRRWLGSVHERRFFLFVHLLLPHAPYEAPPPFAGTFHVPGLPKLDASNRALEALEERKKPLTKAELESLRSFYDERILYLDSLVGSLLEDLRKLDLYEDSVIVFLSDHGEQFGEHGNLLHAHSLYQEEIHIPLLLKLPRGRGPRVLRVPGRVRALDLMPTILDLLKIDPPLDIQGKSLLPLIRGEDVPEEVVFSELNFLGRTAVFKGDYKYIATDPGLYAQGARSHRRRGHGPHPLKNLEEIYDLAKDPGETRNILAERPDLADLFRTETRAFAERAARYQSEKSRSPDANRLKLDKAEREKLRALGYLR